jgi:uncharacterized protein YjbJ (UPF0337 family)
MGKMTGNKKQVSKGKTEHFKGVVQEGFGKVKAGLSRRTK